MEEASGCDAGELWFRFGDPDRALGGVRLVQRIGIKTTDFWYDEQARAWMLAIPRPAAWRVEYQFELRHPDGRTETVNDHGNPRLVPGAFGDKSVLECPDYAPPAWLDAPVPEQAARGLAVPAPSLGRDVDVRVYGPDRPTGLALVAHDGPEFDRLAGLSRFSAAMVAAGRLPEHHLVLLAPGERDDWYSANPAYAEALAGAVLPAVSGELGGLRSVVGLGASLGGLALLHAHHHDPGAFAGLFLQSGSFFLPRLDPQERGFPAYRRIIRFVARAMREPGRPVPAVLTCGAVEENLANNRCMAAALRRHGYPATLVEFPDGHNFTAWRDTLDPHLVGL
ncbi:MAG TPA: alpha/beta hydrolase-fold protein, partial [Micromonosporaceae bacterium]|nr:alpha/beta hydrolase-fold protein [Micromonosporaceae bacterium]